MLKKLKYRLEPFWWGISARWHAIQHLWRGHDVKWRGGGCFDWWSGHSCITCEECPDTSVEDGKHVGLVFWMRRNRVWEWIGTRICGFVGHPLFQHPKVGDQYKEDEVYCYRCMFEAPVRKVWLEDANRPKASQAGTVS